jgi:hypothetical protein
MFANKAGPNPSTVPYIVSLNVYTLDPYKNFQPSPMFANKAGANPSIVPYIVSLNVYTLDPWSIFNLVQCLPIRPEPTPA